MKRKLLTALILSVASTSALAGQCPCPCPFTGFYGTFGMGVMYPAIKNTTTTELAIPSTGYDAVFSPSSRFTDSSVTGGIALGYSALLVQGVLAGIEGRANLENAQTSSNFQSTEANSQLLAQSSTSVNLKNDFAILLKFGLVVKPEVLFYGLIGPDFGNFSINSSGSYSQIPDGSSSISAAAQGGRSKYLTGLLLGFGMETLITPTVSLGLEYNHTWYNNLSFPATSTPAAVMEESTPLPGTFTLTNNTTPQTNVVTLRINYYMG